LPGLVISERIEDAHPALQPGLRAMAERFAREAMPPFR
jgi:hypothetical protein